MHFKAPISQSIQQLFGQGEAIEDAINPTKLNDDAPGDVGLDGFITLLDGGDVIQLRYDLWDTNVYLLIKMIFKILIS